MDSVQCSAVQCRALQGPITPWSCKGECSNAGQPFVKTPGFALPLLDPAVWSCLLCCCKQLCKENGLGKPRSLHAADEANTNTKRTWGCVPSSWRRGPTEASSWVSAMERGSRGHQAYLLHLRLFRMRGVSAVYSPITAGDVRNRIREFCIPIGISEMNQPIGGRIGCIGAAFTVRASQQKLKPFTCT